MFPSEIEILKAADKIQEFNQSRLIHSTDVIGEYIGYIYDSLVRRGFIRGDRSTGYEITKKGRERISEYLSKRALKA